MSSRCQWMIHAFCACMTLSMFPASAAEGMGASAVQPQATFVENRGQLEADDWAFWGRADDAGNFWVIGDTQSSESTFPDGDGFGSLPGLDQTFAEGATRQSTDAFLIKLMAQLQIGRRGAARVRRSQD